MFVFFRLNELSEKGGAGACVFLFLSLEGRLHRSFSGDATGFKDSGLRVVCQVKNEMSVKITKPGLDITRSHDKWRSVRGGRDCRSAHEDPRHHEAASCVRVNVSGKEEMT